MLCLGLEKFKNSGTLHLNNNTNSKSLPASLTVKGLISLTAQGKPAWSEWLKQLDVSLDTELNTKRINTAEMDHSRTLDHGKTLDQSKTLDHRETLDHSRTLDHRETLDHRKTLVNSSTLDHSDTGSQQGVISSHVFNAFNAFPLLCIVGVSSWAKFQR